MAAGQRPPVTPPTLLSLQPRRRHRWPPELAHDPDHQQRTSVLRRPQRAPRPVLSPAPESAGPSGGDAGAPEAAAPPGAAAAGNPAAGGESETTTIATIGGPGDPVRAPSCRRMKVARPKLQAAPPHLRLKPGRVPILRLRLMTMARPTRVAPQGQPKPVIPRLLPPPPRRLRQPLMKADRPQPVPLKARTMAPALPPAAGKRWPQCRLPRLPRTHPPRRPPPDGLRISTQELQSPANAKGGAGKLYRSGLDAMKNHDYSAAVQRFGTSRRNIRTPI